MATYQNDILDENQGPLYENQVEPSESKQQSQSASTNSKESSVPHKLIGDVEYAIANVKSQVSFVRKGGKNDKDSGQDKLSLTGKFPIERGVN